MTTITAPPDPPLRSEGRNAFSAKMEAFLVWLVVFVTQLIAVVTEINAAKDAAEAAAGTAMNAEAVNGHSTSNVTVGTGSKTFPIEEGKGFVVNMFILAAATGATGVWMHGQVTSYDSETGDLVVAVGTKLGTGSYTDWNIGPSAPIVLSPMATAAEIWAGDNTEAVINPTNMYEAVATQTLTDGATITPDFEAGINFTVTLGGNRTLANPANRRDGQQGMIRVKQDGTGNRAIVFGSDYRFFGAPPTLSTTANAVDKLSYYVNADLTVTIGIGKGEAAA